MADRIATAVVIVLATAVATPSLALSALSPAAFPFGTDSSPTIVPVAEKARDSRSESRTGELRLGEYACYGNSGRILIGLGFKVSANGHYTDLDGANAGTYSIHGDDVQFEGGHLGGQVGRNLNSGSFTIGTQAHCEPA
jgi:hypothetical protein